MITLLVVTMTETTTIRVTKRTAEALENIREKLKCGKP